MNLFIYHYQGLRVHSGIEIPEWARFESHDREAPADVRILIQPDFDAEGTPSGKGEYRFHTKAGWFVVRRGTEIIVAAREPISWPRVGPFVIGSAWGALMYQRSLLILHASSVRTERGAFLFCGHRGQGKSTLAAVLVGLGCEMVSDDICRVSVPDDRTPSVYPSSPIFKLWADATRQLALNPDELTPGCARPEKYFYSGQRRAAPEPAPLRAIYLLAWGETRLLRLNGIAALNRTFHAATWRGQILMTAGDPAEHFRQCANLIRLVPVWEFRRPREFGAMAETSALLLNHLERNG